MGAILNRHPAWRRRSPFLTMSMLLLVFIIAHFMPPYDEPTTTPELTLFAISTKNKYQSCPTTLCPSRCIDATKWKVLFFVSLALAGDIETNPGPVWPCAICDYPVTWSQDGIACDGCSVWHHRSCLSMCTDDYHALERPSVVWKCYICDSLNCDSFTFHSYETSNSFSPLINMDTTVDSIVSNVFDPLHTSSPRDMNSVNASRHTYKFRESSSGSVTSTTNPLNLPFKQNLRILNINCRSVRENNTEFKAAVNYIKPDIICGTESWLKGIKPGKPPSIEALKNSEMFPENYTVFRNDRGTRGGGVFLAVQNNITAIECVDFITKCKIEIAKITLKSRKTLYIGCFYMPKRNIADIEQLSESLKLINAKKPNHIIICGDFNCPFIDWETLSVPTSTPVQDKSIHQHLIDTMNDHGLTQIHQEPTRHENLLDLVFTTNPSLIKSSVNAPGISDHAMVIVDSDIRPTYSSQKPRKTYQFSKADWVEIKEDCNKISTKVGNLVKTPVDIEDLWTSFKTDLLISVDKNVPQKLFKNKHSLPWINRKLRRALKKKSRLYKHAKT